MGKQQEEIDNRIEQLQFIIDADRELPLPQGEGLLT
jgi:hypothetical protein